MAQTPPQMQEVEAKAGVTRYTALMSEAVEKLARGEAVEAAANVQRHAFKNTPEEVGMVLLCFVSWGVVCVTSGVQQTDTICHFWISWRHNMSGVGERSTDRNA